MLACRWIKLLTCFVTFWVKEQLMMHFIQNLNLDFHSFLDLYLNGSGASVDNNRWYCMSYWGENLQLLFCLPIKSTHKYKWYIKTLCPYGMKILG